MESLTIKTKDQTTNRDEVSSMAIAVSVLAVIATTLIYEDTRTSLDNSGWYHWVILVIGWMMVVVAVARFLPAIGTLSVPGGYDQEDLRILQRSGWWFRNEPHLHNWIAIFFLGLLLIILEIKWEQDWLRSSGLS